MKVSFRKKMFCILTFFVMVFGIGFAQDASYFSDIIEAEAINWEQASFLVLIGGELVPMGTSPREAWEQLLSTYWFTNVPEIESLPTVAEFCGIATRTLNYKGGLFYTLFKNNRYAYRDLAFKSIVPSHLDPQANLNGLDALKIIEGLLDELARIDARKKVAEVVE